jgi:hypothetical protein
MTEVQLGSTNIWLAMIAVSAVAQLIITLATVALAYRAYRRATAVADEFERDHLRPLALKTHALLDDLQDMAARARTMDDAVRARIGDVESALHSTRNLVQGRLWPVLGVVRALRAGVEAWNGRSTRSAAPYRPAGPRAATLQQENRHV